jgi:hypothetical protein
MKECFSNDNVEDLSEKAVSTGRGTVVLRVCVPCTVCISPQKVDWILVYVLASLNPEHVIGHSALCVKG